MSLFRTNLYNHADGKTLRKIPSPILAIIKKHLMELFESEKWAEKSTDDILRELTECEIIMKQIARGICDICRRKMGEEGLFRSSFSANGQDCQKESDLNLLKIPVNIVKKNVVKMLPAGMEGAMGDSVAIGNA